MPTNWTAAVLFDSATSPELTLTNPNEEWLFTIHVYANMLEDPRETELRMAEIYDVVRETLASDFDASSYGMPAIRNVDMFRVEADFGYQTIPLGGTMYRVMEINVPLLVDDLAAFTA